jgi:hypothetical protein
MWMDVDNFPLPPFAAVLPARRNDAETGIISSV